MVAVRSTRRRIGRCEVNIVSFVVSQNEIDLAYDKAYGLVESDSKDIRSPYYSALEGGESGETA
jgi:hypothetical protein